MPLENHKSIVAMLEKISRKQSVGAILADGVKRAAEVIGNSSEKYVIQIQVQGIPAHNPRLELSFAAAYIVDATPGRHT